MSIQRYDISTPRSDNGDSDFEYCEDSAGGWVDYNDHAAAIADKDEEIDRLKVELDGAIVVNRVAHREVTKLRKVVESVKEVKGRVR